MQEYNKQGKISNKLLSVYIFKSNARGMQYAMGSYIRELTDSLLQFTDININIVVYHNSECKEFSKEIVSARFCKINIPLPKALFPHKAIHDKKYANVIGNLLADIIPENNNVVFQINYIDGLPIAKMLKEKYNYPIVSVVHFALWQELFNGNKKKLNGLNIEKPTNNFELALFKEKEFYHLSDHIVSFTSYMKDFLVEVYGLGLNKIDIVPNGINNSSNHAITEKVKLKLKRFLGFNSDEIIILFSSIVDPGKGVFYLLEAFIEACKYREDLRLVLTGQGSISECLKRCQSSYGRITFTGLIPPEILDSFYQIADIGIVPSIYDHCPNTVLEMMANKIPLILSRIDGLNEICIESQCIFIEPHINENGEITYDIKEISNAILSLVKDKNMAKKLASKAFDNQFRKYSSTSMALEMEKIYLSLTER